MTISDAAGCVVPEEVSGQSVAARHEVHPAASQAVKLPLYFRCEPLGCGVSVSSCAKRYRRIATPAQGYGRSHMDMLHGGPCIDCPIGAAHLDGRAPQNWPDGKPIVRAETTSGLGYNAHKGAGGGRMFVRRGYSVATVPPATAGSSPNQRQCVCGRWFAVYGTRKQCSQCSHEATKAHSAQTASRKRHRVESKEVGRRRELNRALKLADPEQAAKRKAQVDRAHRAYKQRNRATPESTGQGR